MKDNHFVRVRKTFSNGGGSPNFVFHADIKTKSKKKALEMAKEKGNKNVQWRWIDTYDWSDEKYVDYEIIGDWSESE
jgi:hypothetical protein